MEQTVDAFSPIPVEDDKMSRFVGEKETDSSLIHLVTFRGNLGKKQN